jgi:hypothetical protein
VLAGPHPGERHRTHLLREFYGRVFIEIDSWPNEEVKHVTKTRLILGTIAVGVVALIVALALTVGGSGGSSPRTTEEWCADKSRDEDLQIVTDYSEAELLDDCLVAVESFGRQFTDSAYEQLKEDGA